MDIIPIYNPKTLLALTSLLTVAMAGVLQLMSLATIQRIAGISYWASGALLAAIASSLIVLRDVAPTWLTFTAANTAVMLAYSFFWIGSAKYFGQQINLKKWAIFFVITWFVQAYFTYGLESLRGRYISTTGFIFVASLMHSMVFAREIYRGHIVNKQLRIGCIFTSSCIVFSTLIFGARWGHAVFLPQDGHGILDTSLPQVLYIGAYSFGLLIMSIGFLLLASENIRRNFEELAMVDALTGVRSRRAVVEIGHDLFQRSRRSERPFSLMMLDLDHFKLVNDKYGHQVGDLVLQGFCRRIETALRSSDVLGRLGGEEFVVLMPDTNLSQANELAERLLKTSADSDPQLPVLTVSIGISEWRQDDASLEKLLGRADRALYAAKTGGRNRAVAD
jgi:diguanylate cyclase (GGDEF)-like protein